MLHEVLSSWLHPDRPCSYWSSVENSSIFSAIRLPLYLSISLSPTIVLPRSLDRAMHYSSVSFMSLQSWALSKGSKAEIQSIRRSLTLATMGHVDWMSKDLPVNRNVLPTCLCTSRLAGPFSHLQQLNFIGILLPSQWNTKTSRLRRDVPCDLSQDLADPLLQCTGTHLPTGEPALLNPVAGLIMSL